MSELNIEQVRSTNPAILCLGSYRGIIQSMLDFDYLAGKNEPSVKAIVATGRKTERYFFGVKELTIPTYASIEKMPARIRDQINLFLNLTSGRRVLKSSVEAMDLLPGLSGAVVFAEGLPEKHAIELYAATRKRGIWMIGGSSVGLIVPDVVKLGAIGGVQIAQLEQSKLLTSGSVAVISSSGGMVNEIIRAVATSGHALSFSLALGGERFPLLTPESAFLAAEQDPDTKVICYFGELGGTDEYVLVDLMEKGLVTKPVYAYIAGSVAELFDTPPQFGHAKAMAKNADESASAKATAMRAAGINVAAKFDDFISAINQLPGADPIPSVVGRAAELSSRRPALIASTVSGDRGDDVYVLGRPLLGLAKGHSFAYITASMLLGHEITSTQLEEFVDFVLRLLVDHGPYVSGAVNTIVAARAGKDLVSSLTAGLLTIGPRFGGAINEAAATWLHGVTGKMTPSRLVEERAAAKSYISGIGHRKYRTDLPDPRVQQLLTYTNSLSAKRFTSFALGVEAETVRKKGNLILNVDGAIAAILLDILAEQEGYTDDQLMALTQTEFFNALFVVSRSVGFMAHYFDQVRLDEGIFRLKPEDVANVTGSRPDIA